MTDIVERLRGADISGHGSYSALVRDAANEIERLRKAGYGGLHYDLAEAQRQEIERLQNELNQPIPWALERDLRAEIGRLRAVIIRAKDALLDGQSTQWVHDLLVAAILGPKP